MYIIENDNQRPYWELTYKTGMELKESDTNTFQSIVKDIVYKFTLRQPHIYDMELNCETGELYLNRNKIHHPILEKVQHQHINYGSGLIQFKSSRIFMGSQGSSDEILDTANMGYKVSLDGFLYQFIIIHDYDDKSNTLEIKVTDLNTKNIEVETIPLW